MDDALPTAMAFDARALSRARLYLLWGALFDVRRAGPTLRARCEGSTEEVYRVRAELDGDAVRAAWCSCPVGESGGCKHAAALALAWREERGLVTEEPPLDARLARLTRRELVALVEAMTARPAALDDVLASTLPPVRARAEATWRSRAGEVFRGAGAGADAAEVAKGLEAIATGDEVEMHAALCHAVLGRWRRWGAAAGPLLAVARRHIDALGRRLAREGDVAARRAVLEALVGMFRFDIEQGSALGYALTPGRHALARVVEHATAEELSALRDALRDEAERADPWPSRAWSLAVLTVEERLVEGDVWLARAREAQRHGAAARHLARGGRFEEALAELRLAHDAELVEAAEALAALGVGDAVDKLVTARMERAGEAQRARMGAWVKARAEARHNEEALLDALEAELRARPERGAYDALRARAGARWREREARVHGWLAERGHPMLLEVLLDEGRADEALAAVEGDRMRPTACLAQRVRLGDALAAARPHDAVAVYRAAVDGLVATRTRAAYREAARVLARARSLCDDATWAQWVAALRSRHAGLSALQQELGALDGARAA